MKNKNTKKTRKIKKESKGQFVATLSTFVVLLFITLLTGAAIMILWNTSLSPIFGLIKISYLQALALHLLCKLVVNSNSDSKKSKSS